MPAEPCADHQLVRVIGLDAARRMAAEYGPAHLALPRCASLSAAARNIEIQARYAAGGVTREALAREFQLSLRQVHRILGRTRQPD